MQQFMPGYINPYMSAQQRLNYMEQQFPQLAQPQTQPSGFVTLPVSDIAEATAYRVDLNGTPTFFFNAGKNEVYLKKTNVQTGAADFVRFAKAEDEISEVKPAERVNTYEKDFQALNAKIDGLYKMLGEIATPTARNDEGKLEDGVEAETTTPKTIKKGAKND